jgi:beta-lactamase class A
VDRHSNEDSSPQNRADKFIGADFLLNSPEKSSKRNNSQYPRLFPLVTSPNKGSIESGERAKIWNNDRGIFQTSSTTTSVLPSPSQAKKKVRTTRSPLRSNPSPVKQTVNFSARGNRRNRPIKARKKLPLIGKIIPASMSFFRFLVIACGVWAIAGTTVYTVTSYSLNKANSDKQAQQKKISNYSAKTKGNISGQVINPSNTPETKSAPLNLTGGQESTTLKDKLTAIAKKYPTLKPAAFFYELDNQNFVNIEGDISLSAASTIKIPILMAFFQDVDSGKIKLNEMLTLTKELIGSGSGEMQYQKVGKKFSALETATKMIVISDNTATNMLIARLGGKDALNQRFLSWGLEHTLIRNPLPDLEGTNTTSPKDLVKTLALVEKGQGVSMRSRDRILEIMRETRTRTLLPQGIEKDASIAHKTGDIGTILGDAGIIDMPNGKRYIAAVMAKRPYNAVQGRVLIQEFSKTAYQHFKYSTTRPQETFTE